MRLRSDIWIAGYLRRVMAAGAFVAVRRKGVPEGGTIFLRIDHLDGNNQLFVEVEDRKQRTFLQDDEVRSPN